MTSGNILKIYKTKKIKSVTGILSVDNKTGWLWILSFLGIGAFPPSILFISEFLIVKTMFKQNHYIMGIFFLLLLTIVLYGLGKAVINMSTGNNSQEESKLSFMMYIPQTVLLVIAFIMGIYFPFYNNIISLAQGF